jgi:hypothetical protein
LCTAEVARGKRLLRIVLVFVVNTTCGSSAPLGFTL